MPHATAQAQRKRAYRSSKREQQARATKERILAAATQEFVASGYAGTTIRSVANAAGVSVPMVELAFGTKAQLLQAAISFAIRGDAEPLPMLQRQWARRAQATDSVHDFLAAVAEVLVESEQRSAGLVLAALEAARLDRSMSTVAEKLRAQRAETAAWIVDGVLERAAARAAAPTTAVSRKRAIDTIWMLMDPSTFYALTRDRGWTPEQFGRWFARAVELLLTQPTKERKRT